MCICSDRLAVQDYEMHYMNAWLKRCVFNLDLNRESVSEPQTLSGRLFQSLVPGLNRNTVSLVKTILAILC